MRIVAAAGEHTVMWYNKGHSMMAADITYHLKIEEIACS